MYKRLKLTKGRYTLIDTKFEYLFKHLWFFDGYYAVRTDNKTMEKIYLHKVIMNSPKDMVVDHINGNSLDNRLENLRICLPSENSKNIRNLQQNKTSEYKGVHKNVVGSWVAQINNNGIKYYLGSFQNESDAKLAYDKKSLELHKDFASNNDIIRNNFIINFEDYPVIKQLKYTKVLNTYIVKCSNGKIYNSISECAKDLGVKPNTIVKACTSKVIRKVKGFKVEYIGHNKQSIDFNRN